MHFYLFVTVDASSFSGSKQFFAEEIVSDRLKKGKWPIYSKTANKDKIKIGDKCLFYVGGNGLLSKHILGTGSINNIYLTNEIIDDVDALTDLPYKQLELTDIKIYTRPIFIKDFLEELSFIPDNKSRWGVALQGGCKNISKRDYYFLHNLVCDI